MKGVYDGGKVSEFGGFKCLENLQRVKNRVNKSCKTITRRREIQINRSIDPAARSITNNIAEGYGRFHYQENLQYLRQGRGSLYECLDHLYCMLDDGYIDKAKFEVLKEKFKICLKLINGYIKFLKSRKLQS